MIFSSIADALAQAGDPKFRGVLIKGIGLTVGLLLSLYALIFFGVQILLPDTVTLPFIGEVGFVDTLVSFGSLILMLILSVFLMIPVASAFTGLFIEEVSDAVEARHYPGLPPVEPIGIAANIRESVGFLGVLVAGLDSFFSLTI